MMKNATQNMSVCFEFQALITIVQPTLRFNLFTDAFIKEL